MASYDLKQQVFCVSMLSNFPSSMLGPECEIAQKSTAEVIETLNKDGVIQLVGEWEVVWGLGIFQVSVERKDVADNAMFVAKNKSGPTRYIIGIAGTNPNSWYSWLIEDFFVSKVIPWPYASTTDLSPKISAGSASGLKHLQQMKPCAGLPGEGLTIQEFITEAISTEPPNSSIEVISSGHSLGGALSPTLALWLQDIKSEWDPDNKTTLSTYPSAGATAGDKDFASYSNRTLGSNCTRIWNRLDIVPHAWNVDQLRQIPSLFEPEITPGVYVDWLVELAILNTNHHPYMQIEVDTAPLPGEVLPPDPSKEPFIQFLTEAFYQHFFNYFNLLEVQAFWPYISGKILQTADDPLSNLSESQPSAQAIAQLKARLEKFGKSQK